MSFQISLTLFLIEFEGISVFGSFSFVVARGQILIWENDVVIIISVLLNTSDKCIIKQIKDENTIVYGFPFYCPSIWENNILFILV